MKTWLRVRQANQEWEAAWGGAGAPAVEPLARSGIRGEGERRPERRVLGLRRRSWGEGALGGEWVATGD